MESQIWVVLSEWLGPWRDEGAPWLYAVNRMQCLVKFTAKDRMMCLGRALLPRPVTPSHMNTSLHKFPDHFQARRACHPSPVCRGPVFSLCIHAAPPSACLLRAPCSAYVGLGAGAPSPLPICLMCWPPLCESAWYIQAGIQCADAALSDALPCHCLGAEGR